MELKIRTRAKIAKIKRMLGFKLSNVDNSSDYFNHRKKRMLEENRNDKS